MEVDRPAAAACSGALRHVRAGSVSLVAIGLAAGGHVAGGGAALSLPWFLLVWALAARVCWYLSRRRWTVRTLTGALVLVQAVMHVLCSVGSTAGTAGEAAGVGGAPMLVAHAVATAASVAALRHGEATLWSLLDALLLRPTALGGVRVLEPPRRPVVSQLIWRDARAVAARSLVRIDPQRGPPHPA